MLGYETPLTYPDRLDRLNLLALSYRRDISVLCQLYQGIYRFLGYQNIFKILAYYPQIVYILEMTRDVLDNLNNQIFKYHDVKIGNLEHFILT